MSAEEVVRGLHSDLKVAQSDIRVNAEVVRDRGDDPDRVTIQDLVAGEANGYVSLRQGRLITQVITVPVRRRGVIRIAIRFDEQSRRGCWGEDMSAVRRARNDRLRISAEYQVHLSDPVDADCCDGMVTGSLQVVAGNRLQQGTGRRLGLGEKRSQRFISRAL